MKALYTAFLAGTTLCAQAETFELTNTGNQFSPPMIELTTDDEVHITLPAPHTCTEVSAETWAALGNTPLPGGFNFGSGTHTWAPTAPGVYYFVCSPHASMGMIGRFMVTSPTGVGEHRNLMPMKLSPNPATSTVSLGLTSLDASTRVNVMDVNGRLVLQVAAPSNGTLDVSGLETGNYTLVMLNAQGDMLSRERLVIAR